MRSAAVLLIVLLAPAFAWAADGAAIVYGLHTPSEEQFQRLLSEPSVRYICTQQIFTKTGVPALARTRAAALAKADKRVILQIWWGPDGDFNWAKYSFANVALDKAIRADFFREVVDACIDQYGAENLYGVHLMEETGMQFATDVDRREDPDIFKDFEEDGHPYNAPFWSGYGDLPGGVHIANVRRHEKDFTRMTGLRFADEKNWGTLEHHLFARWVSTRLQSGGQVEFAKHVHQKYPGMKAFTWDLLRTGSENPRTDFHLEAQHFDGVICDVYNVVNFNFLYQRAYRLLCPNAEIIHFAMGGMGKEQGYPYATRTQKRVLTVGALLAGVDVFGFFELPQDFTRPEAWDANCDIFRRLQPVPRFRKQPSLLLLANSVSNIYSCTPAWTGLTYFDFLPTWEAHDVNLDPYQAVILHVDGPSVTDSTVFWNAHALQEKFGLPGHVDYRALDEFVARGGVLILSGQVRLDPDCPLFLVRDGYLHTQGAGNAPVDPLVISPRGWLKEHVGLGREYRFSASRIDVKADRQRVVTTEGGYFLRHGKGAVFLLPFNRFYDPKEADDSPQWQDYRQFLTDVTRGVLQHMGKRDIATEYLADSARGNYYMQATSDDGRWAGSLLFNPKLMVQPEWRLAGTDVLTGQSPAVLTEDSPAALVTGAARERPAEPAR